MIASPKSMKVKINVKQNRLYFTIAGKITKRDLDKLYTDIRFGVADLQKGFDVVTDLTGCHLGHISGVPTFRKIMHYLITCGVGTVIRVINTNSLIYRQIINFASRVPGYKPIYLATLEQAEEMLSKEERRKGLRFQLHKTLITYNIENQEGTGKVLDLSTSGCAVEDASYLPRKKQNIQLKFSLNDSNGEKINFEVMGVIARLAGGGFAVQFVKQEGSSAEQIWDCLVCEMQRDL